ncbi:MAG TPA: hypothetical protein VKC53_00140 [Patescibacteria group bacterium]|nr:hypothetical protein [Patescibacteria group bacterium]
MKKFVSLLVIAAVVFAAVAVIVPALAKPADPGGSVCDQDPSCDIVPPSDSGTWTAPSSVTVFCGKLGNDKTCWGQGTNNVVSGVDGACWDMSVNGSIVTWNRLSTSNVCQDPSHFEGSYGSSSTSTTVPDTQVPNTATQVPNTATTVPDTQVPNTATLENTEVASTGTPINTEVVDNTSTPVPAGTGTPVVNTPTDPAPTEESAVDPTYCDPNDHTIHNTVGSIPDGMLKADDPACKPAVVVTENWCTVHFGKGSLIWCQWGKGGTESLWDIFVTKVTKMFRSQ